ncbi:MAG: OsmC family protein [Promethearchaeota archaeon]
MSTKKLLSEEIITAYKNRLQSMNEHKFTKKGDELFIKKLIAETEQVNNLHVRTKIGEFIIENDESKELGGSNTASTPMQMLLAALANCLEITALLLFSFSNYKIDAIKVKVKASFDIRSILPDKKAPLPGFYDISYTWYVETEERLKKIERVLAKAEKLCPVKGTFSRKHVFKQDIVLLTRNKKK